MAEKPHLTLRVVASHPKALGMDGKPPLTPGWPHVGGGLPFKLSPPCKDPSMVFFFLFSFFFFLTFWNSNEL
jgi:hypothetical protein